ncbi:MAG: FAD-dependent oxidoreductase [Nocardioidaceae bacterium]
MNFPGVDRRSSLNLTRRAADLGHLATSHGAVVDVLVVGGGVTGAGVALAAASRGLSVVLAERHDLAFGTSGGPAHRRRATGVWAGEVAPGIALRPSRGSHLVLPASRFGGLDGRDQPSVLTVPVPGAANRFVMAIPAPGGRVYVGLTDHDAPGPVPDVPEATDAEVDFLLATVNTVLERPVGREDLLGTFAGLRPLLDAPGASADLSRRHAVRTAADGLVTVVGGKLTTYRRMAQDGLDAALDVAGSRPGRAVPHACPWSARHLEPSWRGSPVSTAELLFAVHHEGALDACDLLDRRTRIGLGVADRAAALPRARAVIEEFVHRGPQWCTIASSSPIADQCDALQYTLGEGPCLGAIADEESDPIEDSKP